MRWKTLRGKSGKEAQSMGLMIDKPAKTLIERFAQKQPGGHFACPRCGKMTMDAESVTHNALSRRIGCYICDTCGTVEALEDFAHKQNSLNVWAITKEPGLWRMLSWNSDGIEIAGHEGTWYVIDEGDFQITPDVDGKPETLTAHLFLLESELYGEDAAGLIVNDEKQIVMEDVWNGFDDLEDAGWEKARKIECPVCKGEFLREDMTFTRDCHGITYRLVCFDCYDKVMGKGYDGEYYTEACCCPHPCPEGRSYRPRPGAPGRWGPPGPLQGEPYPPCPGPSSPTGGWQGAAPAARGRYKVPPRWRNRSPEIHTA